MLDTTTSFDFKTELVNKPHPHNGMVFNTKLKRAIPNKKERAYQAELQLQIARYMHNNKISMFGKVPLYVEYEFGFEPLNSFSKKDRVAALLRKLLPVSNRNQGDLDNLEKSTQDVLNGLAIDDDRFIVAKHSVKYYTEKPCVAIRIKELEI